MALIWGLNRSKVVCKHSPSKIANSYLIVIKYTNISLFRLIETPLEDNKKKTRADFEFLKLKIPKSLRVKLEKSKRCE